MADDSDQLDQDEIEKLLAQGGGGAPSPPPSEPAADTGGGDASGIDQSEIEALLGGGGATAPAATTAAAPPPNVGQVSGSSDVELLLNRAQEAIASLDAEGGDLPPGMQAFELEDFGGTPANEESATLELVRDVQLDLKIELGRTRMPLEDVLRLRSEAVVTLDKLAGDPVDIYVNQRLVARGEVLVLNENFCVRVTELIVGDKVVA